MNQRYIRQTLLHEIGHEGQSKLSDSSVAIIGCGGLGSIVAPYLAGSGVGHLILVDADMPHVSNLHRQVFFSSADLSESKAKLLSVHIKGLNPDIKVTTIKEMLSKSNIDSVIDDVDIVIECTDDMMTKYLVNDFCALKGKALIYGAIYKYDGYVSLFKNSSIDDIHLRDIFPVPQLDIPTCSEVGVLNTIAGIIGLFQANEAIKYIVGFGENLVGKLLSYSVLNNEQYKLTLKKTFNKNLNDIYSSESYQSLFCNVGNEISLNELMNNRETYHLVSILEDFEHRDIDGDVQHMAMSKNDLGSYSELRSPVVFYCQSGMRSLALVNQLLAQNTHAEFLSLKDGLNSLRE